MGLIFDQCVFNQLVFNPCVFNQWVFNQCVFNQWVFNPCVSINVFSLETPRIAGTIERIIESEQCSSTSIQLAHYLHTLISQVFLCLETLEAPRIAGTIEWKIESEQCSSTSIQLVQLPTPSNSRCFYG